MLIAVGAWRSVGQGVPLGEALREMLVFAISLAVGAIPEGLPAIVTIALAVGVQRMARAARHHPQAARGGDARLHLGHLLRQDRHAHPQRDDGAGALDGRPERWRWRGSAGRGEGGFRHGGAPAAPSEAAARLLEAAALCSDATVEARRAPGGR